MERSAAGETWRLVTLDGVIGDPQEWGPPYWNNEHMAYASKLMGAAESLLLGRETYEGFAEAWSQRSGDEYTDKINSMPKHVASRALTGATWNATILEGDVADAVAALKQDDGGDILKFGTGELDQTLLEHGLLDELHLWVFPPGSRCLTRPSRHPLRSRLAGTSQRHVRWSRPPMTPRTLPRNSTVAADRGPSPCFRLV